MGRVTAQLSVSLDVFAAGPDQSLADPLGVGGAGLHTWEFAGEAGVDAEFAAASRGRHDGSSARDEQTSRGRGAETLRGAERLCFKQGSTAKAQPSAPACSERELRDPHAVSARSDFARSSRRVQASSCTLTPSCGSKRAIAR